MKPNSILNRKFKFIDSLFENFAASMEKFLSVDYYATVGSKNYSKTAIKRKITYLRQELLNLEKMMDGDADD